VVVVLEPLIVPVMEICGFAVALGIIFVLHHFVSATVGGIAGIVSRLPGIGGIIGSPLNRVYHWMDSEFGKAEHFLDSKMAAALHELARLCEWVGKEFHDHASLLLAVANVMTHPLSLSAYRALWVEEWKALGQLNRAIYNAGGGSIGAAIHKAIKPITGELRGLERWTYPRVKAAEHAIDVTIPHDIAGLRARSRTIEDSLDSLWKKVRGLDKLIVDTAFVGAVSVALARLNLGWLRCDSLGNIGRRLGCGGFGLIEELLVAEATVLAATDLCDFADAAMTLAKTIRPVLMELVDVEDALVGCHGAVRPQTLPLPALRLPSNSLGLQLAA
jgi:hypothetical protein